MSPFAGTRAVTFDCWGTLIYEPDAVRGREVRVTALCGMTGLPPDTVAELLQTGWQAHHDAWTAERQHGAPGIAAHIAAAVGAGPDVEAAMRTALEDASLSCDVVMVPDALGTLAAIKSAGLATALICDTGFSPGRVVRQLLGRYDLTDHLDALIFSDEIGVPKPAGKMFASALDAIGGGPAVHVGDLRRTDIAGARAAGLGSVRFRGVYDDASDHPEADIVVDRLADVLALVGVDAA